MDDEDRLVIPDAWHIHIEGRPGGRLTLEQAELLTEDAWAFARDFREAIRDSIAAAYTLVAERGVDAVELLAAMIPLQSGADAAVQRAVGEALAVIPSDAAFEALVDRAVQASIVTRSYAGNPVGRNERQFAEPLRQATDRFPRRAVRVLAARVAAGGVAESRYESLLRAAVSRHAEAARQAAEALDPAAAAPVRALLDAPTVDHAPREAWPEVLRDPPWARAKKKKLAPAGKVPLTPLEHPIRVDWRGEERARWRRPEGPPERWAELDEAGWRDAASRLVDGEDDYWTFALMAPRPVAVDVVRRFTDVPTFKAPDAIRAVVARLEADALPMVERWVARPWALEAALPLGSPTLARAVAEGLTKASTREVARAWLSRHAEAAAIGLVPAALGADAKARKAGIAGLSFLVREGHRARVADVATRYGDAAARALAPLLEASPLDEVPSRLPKLPAFWDPAALPPLVLATGGALPPDAVGLLGTMLAFSPPGAPYAGIRMVKEACTRESVAAFTWGLFEAWMQAGAPNESSWAFLQLGWLGDDSIAYRLVTRMKAWPGQGAAKRAEKGLDVLAEMDSDVALVLVHQLSQKGRGSLRKNAAKKLTRLAAVRGLGEAELADRLVPTLDLDADGSMRLDYGPRAFTVGFDEELLPFVLDANGARLEALPRPGKRDDPALAPAAEARFKALKKAVRTVAKTQLTRLERAMATERRWSGRDFRRWVVEHPLLVHVARRLVFGVYDGQSLVTSFRVADDRSYADPDDARVVVGDDATVGIAHPVDLSPEAIERWREVLNDYELVPPFPQLERERIAPPDGERGRVLAEALGATVAPNRVAALEDHGWIRGPVGDAAMFDRMERVIGPGRALWLVVRPGMISGMVHASDPQTLEAVHVIEGGREASIEVLSRVAFGELIRDLDLLAR